MPDNLRFDGNGTDTGTQAQHEQYIGDIGPENGADKDLVFAFDG